MRKSWLIMFLGCGHMFVGCVPPEPEVALNLPVRGLWTNPDESLAPVGSLETADNATFTAPGVIEPRRGFAAVAGSLSGAVNQLTYYDGQLIAHHGSSSISRSANSGASWTAYSGTFSPPDASTKARFFQASQSLFVLCSDGVYQLDSGTGTWRLTGAPKPLDGTATLRRTANETGFATANGQWAYRDVWGYRDANGHVQLSEVSGRVLVTNPANITATAANVAKAGSAVVTVTNTTHGFATGEYVDVTLGGAETNFTAGRFSVTVVSSTSFTYNDGGASATANPANNVTYGFTSRNVTRVAPFPSGITTGHFLQVYRSAKSATASTEPTDRMGLVYEKILTNLDVTAGTVTITDITPDELRSTELYTSIRGLVSNKVRPPAAHDAAVFRSSAFYIDTQSVQAVEMQLLAVGSGGGLVAGDQLVFADDISPISDTFLEVLTAGTTEDTSIAQFKVHTSGSASQNIADTARSLVRCISAYPSGTLRAEYLSSDTDVPGRFRVYARTVAGPQFYAFTAGLVATTYWSPGLYHYSPVVNGGLVRVSNVVTATQSVAHGYAVGQQVTLALAAAEANFTAGSKTIATVPSSTTFTYSESGADATSGSPIEKHRFFGGPIAKISAAIDRTNRIAFSEPDEPWAVPLVNELYATPPGVLPGKLPILKRLTATRDRLFVWSDSGLFQVTGDWPNFVLTQVEDKLQLVAPETAVGIDSRAYGVTNQGAVEVVETPRIIDTPVHNTFRSLQNTAASALATYAFGVAYDADRKYVAWLPTDSSSTKATQGFVYHQDSQDWTRWPVDATCGFVNPADGKLYLGLSTGAVWQELKAETNTGGNLLDFYQTTASVTINSITGSSVVLASASGVSVGDAIGISGTYALITAIDSNTLTVVSDTGLTTGAATIFKKYDMTVRWLRQDFDKPEAGKVVDSGLLRFRGAGDAENVWYQVALDFRTNYSPSFDASQTLVRDTDVPSEAPFWLPRDKQRSTWLQPQVTHAQALRRPKIEGLSLRGRIAGPRGGR